MTLTRSKKDPDDLAALREWEPRIEVVKVTVSLVDVAALACVVEWKFAAGVAEESFVTNLALGVAK